jgi:hypothetical protein
VTDDGGGVPPDPQGAVGPEHLLTMTNTRFAAQRKDGTFARTWSPAQFWASVSKNDLLFDPRVMYDAPSGRWIAVIATASADPALLLALSDGPDPTLGWTFLRIPADPLGDNAAEFPLLGGNGRWICLTANLISLSSGESGGVAVWAVEKAPLLTGGAPAVSRFVLPDAVSPVAPVVTLDADQPDEFLLEQWSENNGGHGQLELSRVTDVGGIAKLKTVATISAPAGNTWTAHPNPFDALPQAGTPRRITASQDDVASACLRNGMIWAAQTATIPAAGSVPEHSVGASRRRGRFPASAASATRRARRGSPTRASRSTRGTRPSSDTRSSRRRRIPPPGTRSARRADATGSSRGSTRCSPASAST